MVTHLALKPKSIRLDGDLTVSYYIDHGLFLCWSNQIYFMNSNLRKSLYKDSDH